MRQLIFLASLFILSCGSYTPRNAELTVTYEGEIVHRVHPANSMWATEVQFHRRLGAPGKKYIIFGAEWCVSCHRLYRGLKEGGYLSKVVFLDADQPWANKIVRVFNVRGFPTLFVLEGGEIKLERFGAGQIAVYLVANVELEN